MRAMRSLHAESGTEKSDAQSLVGFLTHWQEEI